MVENNKTKGNLNYTIRVYSPGGTLIQPPFICEFDKILSPREEIDLSQGLYEGKYNVIAIGKRDCKEDLTDEEIAKSTLNHSTVPIDDNLQPIEKRRIKYSSINYDIADAEIIKESKKTLERIPSGCSRGVTADWNYCMYGKNHIEGTRTNLFVIPVRYSEPIPDAYFSSFGWVLNSYPKIRKSLVNKELVTEFNRDYIKKGLVNKFVDLVGKKLGKDITTRGGRNFTKKAIAAGLIGAMLLGSWTYDKVKNIEHNNNSLQKLEQIFDPYPPAQ